MWGIWADLPLPTILAGFGEERLERARDVLRAHAGEVARNDYVALLGARAVAGRVLGVERVFGAGSAGGDRRYADLLTEAFFRDGEWWAGAPREPDLLDPLAPVPADRPLGWWMHEPSFGRRLTAATAGGRASAAT
jgi:hypothetical protein